MENNSIESGKPRETVTLVLKERRFEVEKQKLIDKSQYFAALLSANYLECNQREHVINYDIPPNLLQDFIDWIHNNKITSTRKNSIEELDHLLILLELSVLFATDNLIEVITNRLERHYMLPEKAINIWLLAQELNINVLRDVSLAVCLDRFDELPSNSICELSKENFINLIGNVNIRYTESHLYHISHAWMKYHREDITVSLARIVLQKKEKILNSIISCEHNNREQFIHCWDGNDFFELTSFKYPDVIKHCRDTGRCLEGMQITGRRYDLYLCGGEYGIGSERFNKNIWRYSLISKKWFLETVMPVGRRHMITVFLKNKLLFVGGVGQYQQKLYTTDIYDIYTGIWTSGGTSVFSFTSVPKHFISDDKLIICEFMPSIYIYSLDRNIWEKFSNEFPLLTEVPDRDIPILVLKTLSCYIDIVDQDEMILKTITDTCNMEHCNHCKIITYPYLSIKTGKKLMPYHLPYMLTIKKYAGYTFLYLFSREVYRNGRPSILLCIDSESDLKMLHLHSIPIQNPRKFRSLSFTKKDFRGFFNLNHPAHLHTVHLNHIFMYLLTK